MLRTPFDLGELAPPGGAVPDLEVVVDARDDDVAAELRVLDQCGRDPGPALLVELRLRRAGEEEALHPAALLAERVERREATLDERVPVRARVRVQAAVDAPRHDDPVHEGLPEPGRQGEAVLVVDGVLVFAEEHAGPRLSFTTFPHDKPLCATSQPRQTTSSGARLRRPAAGRSRGPAQ